MTRIWTQRLPVTSSKEEYLSGLDAPLWACIMSRGVVADYHTECARAFGGARRYKLDEQGSVLYEYSKFTNTVSFMYDIVGQINRFPNMPNHDFVMFFRIIINVNILFNNNNCLCTGQYLFSTLKTTAESTVDALVRAVALQWPLTTGSIRCVSVTTLSSLNCKV